MRHQNREFIIVGQLDTGSYRLWDVAPAPTDPAKRATVLEEITVDAMDAFGSVHTEYATTAREAVDQLLAHLRARYGDDFALAADSNLDAYNEDAPPADPTEPYGKATTTAATRDSLYEITASVVPGTPHFNVDGLPVRSMGATWTRDRVRAGISNSGLDWPTGNVLVKAASHAREGDGVTSIGTSGLDLAIAVTVLAAAGQVPAECLEGAALVAELGLDGRLRTPYGLPSTVRRLAEDGTTTVIVPDSEVTDLRHTGARVIGASSLNEVLALLAGHWHHQNCAPCDQGSTTPHRPSTARASRDEPLADNPA
ncbi:magnesium chelatase domain-containing protein [Streptomyces sp. DH8]|uniref:magnesium chelatase domain-containing protein n=1 Tax=Streptomyces sp. DH8 TaxID=2857008 RepID=UPI001E32F42D|nr:magnesium chelatase domain-containing protein [Streptomyces sp. DH8]